MAKKKRSRPGKKRKKKAPSGKKVPRVKKRATRKKRPRPVPRKRAPMPIIPMILLVISAAILLTSTLLPWGGLNVETKLGIIPVSLNAEVYEYGVAYEADLSGTDLIQTEGNANQMLKDERIFLTGLGEFQETIGFVKGSSKYKNHTIELYTLPDNNRAKVLVETYVSNIPWWPVGLPQEASITCKIVEPPVNITHVEIKKVWFEIHRTVDGNDVQKKVWETVPGDKIKNFKDSRTYTTTLTADENWGKFSVVGRAEMELIDAGGASNNGKELRSFAGNPKMVDLWTIPQDKITRIGMMIAAFPLTIVSGILLVLSAVCAFKRKRWAWKVALAGAVLALLSILFYMTGINALIELTGYIDWFYWDMVGMSVAFTGAGLAIASTVMMFLKRPPPMKKKRPLTKRKKAKGPEKRVKVDAGKPKVVPSAGSEDTDLLPDDNEDEDIWMPTDEE